MPNTSPSANMSLPIPVVGTQSGPQYAININDCLTILDAHNHTPGNGALITTAALNINGDLTVNAHNLTSIKSARFSSQSSTLVGAADLGCLYEVSKDLYYNDGNGTAIRITQNGAVAGTPGSIANLVSPASASYVSASSSFVFQSDTNTPAYIDGASILLRNLVASGFALTLEAPTLGANYTLTLPALPGSKKIVTLNSAGAFNADYDVDNSTLEVASNNLRIKASGVGTAQIADASVTLAKLASGVVQNLKTATFVANGNWTCPSDVTKVLAYGCGGGGGGGAGGTSGYGGDGGGGTSLGFYTVTVVPTTIYPVAIGAAGAGGSSSLSGQPGSNGGNSTFNGVSFAGGLGGVNGGTVGSVTGKATHGTPGGNGPGGQGGVGGIPSVQLPGVGGGYGAGGGGGAGTNANPGADGYQGFITLVYSSAF